LEIVNLLLSSDFLSFIFVSVAKKILNKGIRPITVFKEKKVYTH
jgi:hypothetical protein